MTVGPLLWLLAFDFVVCVIYWLATSVFGMTAPDKLMKVMIGLVILINVVVVLVWLLGVFGVAPSAFMQGPYKR
jgi:multisubunit Na+/H+ antiporter MnhC subunit